MNCGHCDVCRDRALAVWRERALRAETDADDGWEYAHHNEGCSGEHGDEYRCKCGYRTYRVAHDDAVAQRGEP